MSCTTIQPELVAYHFGELSPETRSDVEEHLLSCRRCLSEFIDLKRAIETGDGDRPSDDTRLALRRAVAAELAPPPRPWSWWERPTALLLAGATVVVALMVLQAVFDRRRRPAALAERRAGLDRTGAVAQRASKRGKRSPCGGSPAVGWRR